MLFMIQDMAVPHILVPTSSRAGRNSERHFWEVEAHNHAGYLARVHTHRLLPPQLGLVWTTRMTSIARCTIVGCNVERLASQHLNIDQVEVDWVGIPRQVSDLPDLGGVPSLASRLPGPYSHARSCHSPLADLFPAIAADGHIHQRSH